MSTLTGPIFSPISEFVVILVRADPNPFDAIVEPPSDSAVVIADSNRESFSGTTLEPLETKRGMIVVLLPEFVVPARELLNPSGERGVKFPKARRCSRSHAGQSRNVPSERSRSASSKRRSSLPETASLSIWSSHAH